MSSFKIKDGVDFYNQPHTDKEYLVNEIIGVGDICVLAGDTGLGKSLIAHQIGVQLALGNYSVLGFEIPTQRRVLYLNFEMSQDEFNRRHHKIVGKYGNDPLLKNFNANVSETQNGLFEDNWDKIEETVENSYPFDLIIVDNLYSSTDVNDEKNFDLKKILKKVFKVSSINNTAMLLVTHHRKHSPDEIVSSHLIRGGSTLVNAMDVVLQVGVSQQDSKLRYLKITKNRSYSPNQNKALGLRLGEDTLHFDNIGEISEVKHLTSLSEEQTNLLNDLPGKFSTKEVKQVMNDMGYSKRSVFDWLSKLLQSEHIVKNGHGSYCKL